MSSQIEIKGNGIIHYVDPETLILSKGKTLYKSVDSGDSWEKWCTLPVSLTDSLWTIHKWSARLSRKEIYHLFKVDNDYFGCFGFGKTYLIHQKTTNVKEIGQIEGSRPLCVCAANQHIYYGVYTGNPERKPIPLYQYDIAKEEWSSLYTFKNIRHIHGVFWDKYAKKLWVTTGDFGAEATIWRFDDKAKPTVVASGSQQTRAVQLLFTEKAVFYASDAPDEQNYIYKLDRQSEKITKLQAVGGSVFYGRKQGKHLFFNTVVEPSKTNRMDAVELWHSRDEGETWELLQEFKKDKGHLKYFQYGQLKFPSGSGDSKNFWLTPYATALDHKVVRIRL